MIYPLRLMQIIRQEPRYHQSKASVKNIRDSVVLSKTARFSEGRVDAEVLHGAHFWRTLPLSPRFFFLLRLRGRVRPRDAHYNFLSAVIDPGGSGQQVASFEGEPRHVIGRIAAGTSAAGQTHIWWAEFAYGCMSTAGWDSQTGPGADG